MNFITKKVEIAKNILKKNVFTTEKPITKIFISNCFLNITIFKGKIVRS